MKGKIKICTVVGIAIALIAPVAPAALLSGSVSLETNGQTFDLTAMGDVDWAYWNESSTDGVASMEPSNSKAGGTAIFGATYDGGATVRGSTSTTVDLNFSFTNGDPVVSGSVTNPVGVFNSSINRADRGVTFSVMLPTTNTYTIYVWAGGYGVDEGTFTASMTGVDPWVNSSMVLGSLDLYLYTITAQADSDNDILDLSLVLTQDNTSMSASNVRIVGAAVSSVPEPATMSLLGLAGAGLLMVRRFVIR